MGVKILVEVVEHYDDEAPEHWGQELVDKLPDVGDVLQLHWLKGDTKMPGGRLAHKIKVTHVDNEMGGPTVHGVAVEEGAAAS